MRKLNALMFLFIGLFILPHSPAQETAEPGKVKLDPARCRNRYISVKDIYLHHRAGIPLPLSQAGYESSQYYTFGLRLSGLRCFLRRTLANEDLLSEIKNGDRITVTGYVKQPVRTVKNRRGFRNRIDLDLYVLEVRDITPGWQ